MAQGHAEVARYCNVHRAEYTEWTDEEAARLLRQGWILALLLLLASAWTFHRSEGSSLALLANTPALLCLLACSAVHSARPNEERERAVEQTFLAVALIVLGMLHGVVAMAAGGKPVINAPIQFILFLCCAFLPAGLFRSNARAGVILTIAGAAYLGLGTGVDFVAARSIQFALGLGVGLVINRHLTLGRMYRFQSVHAHSSTSAHVLSELTKMVHPHVVEHIWQGGALESSMPVGKGEACVLAFDVIESSRHTGPQFSAALERVLARCHARMMDGYGMDPLQANAFRLKDLGDGFLATVGFPFAVPTGREMPELAVQLAEECVRIFEEETAELSSALIAAGNGGIHCCVGLAHGIIEGYFPVAGVRSYELRGQAIMLATRYESLRRVILPKHGLGNLIVARDDLHGRMRAPEQALFTEWDTRGPGRAVRDDPHMSRAWYRYVTRAQGTLENGAAPEGERLRA